MAYPTCQENVMRTQRFSEQPPLCAKWLHRQQVTQRGQVLPTEIRRPIPRATTVMPPVSRQHGASTTSACSHLPEIHDTSLSLKIRIEFLDFVSQCHPPFFVLVFVWPAWLQHQSGPATAMRSCGSKARQRSDQMPSWHQRRTALRNK